jgi:hypothetical protein
MHVHIPPHVRPLVNLLFLAHGMTAVRETGDADGTTFSAREQVRTGRLPGVRIFTSGPVLDGEPPFLPTSWVVRDAGQGRRAVARAAEMGADFIKVHHRLSAAALAGIREEAARRGLRLVGHIPSSVSFEQAGIWDVQHLDGLAPYPAAGESALDYQRRWIDLTPGQIAQYVESSVRQGLVHTPTLVSAAAMAEWNSLEPEPDSAVFLLPRQFRQGSWDRRLMPVFRHFTDETLQLARHALERSLEVVRRLHEAGVRLHLGTDTAGMPGLVPGACLQRELGWMVKAGLSLEEAWIAGTRSAGESLGVDRLGRICTGAPADLLLFAQDPTRDLWALATLQAVVAQGRLYTRHELMDALVRHRQRFEQPLYDHLSTAFIRWMMRWMMRGASTSSAGGFQPSGGGIRLQ